MKQYVNEIYSINQPSPIEITDTRVFVASNIEPAIQLNSNDILKTE